jgi:metallophosphoesterase (TIGR00282 family)
MNILYIGDVMAEPGIRVVERMLPEIRAQHTLDLVIAQAENLSDGKGIRRSDMMRLQKAGVQFFSGGNHSIARPEIYPALQNPQEPIIRPANYLADVPGLGYKYAHTAKGDVLVVSLLGQIVGKDADKPMDNPLQVIDRILEEQKDTPHVATVVNFHGDFSSEKRIIGYYLDGRVSAVIGDHWHVPTADADVLPKSTAHITDVGMCGSLDSSLGVTLASLIPRWRDGYQTRNELEVTGRMQFNALLIDVDEQTGLARAATQLRNIF